MEVIRETLYALNKRRGDLKVEMESFNEGGGGTITY